MDGPWQFHPWPGLVHGWTRDGNRHFYPWPGMDHPWPGLETKSPESSKQLTEAPFSEILSRLWINVRLKRCNALVRNWNENFKNQYCISWVPFKTIIRFLIKAFFSKTPSKNKLSTLEKLARNEFKDKIHYNDIEPKVIYNQCWLLAEIHQKSKSGPWQNPFF